MTKQWRDVVGYEGYYQVSDAGRVKRIKAGQGAISDYILKPCPTHDGYLRVCLHKNDGGQVANVHKLVLEAFVAPRPPGMEANHRDGNKENNHLDNLHWVSHSENVLHAYRVLNVPTRKGEAHGQSKLTASDVRKIRRLHALGNHTQDALAQLFGISQPYLSRIVHRKNWTHI